MQLPIIAHRGQAKPYGSIPRINWAHPLAGGLVSYGYDVGSGPIDLVTGGQRTINNTGTPFGGFKSSKYGTGLFCASGGPTDSLCLLPGSTDISNIAVAAPYSYAGGLMLTAAPTGFTRLFAWCDATTGIPVMAGTDSVVATDYWFRFAATDSNTAAGFVKLNQFQTLLGVALTSAAAATYVDGVLATSPSLTTTQAATADCRPAFMGLRSAAGSSLPPGFIYYTALWKGRALTASEARLLHDDPYCFLIYPEDEMFASLVGGALAGSDDPVFCIAGDDGRSFTQMLGY